MRTVQDCPAPSNWSSRFRTLVKYLLVCRLSVKDKQIARVGLQWERHKNGNKDIAEA